MRQLSLIPSLAFIHLATAVIIPFRGFPRDTIHHDLSKRGGVTGVSIENGGNVLYAANITLGGTSFGVVLDTGSSDLWVAGDVPGTQDTGKSASIAYAVGEAKGNVNLATLTFDNSTVDKQAYILVEDTSSFSPALKINGFQGLMGLGFDTGSVVRGVVGNGAGDTPLSRIFQLNKTTQNFISLQLDRQNDPTDSITGQITVSEFISGYESVASQPKLSVKDVPFLDTSSQHWAVLTDKNGVIGPDGNVISVESIVPHVRGGQLVAVLDSGFTLSQVPRKMADAIYGRVQGANYSVEDGLWMVPCDQQLNITFLFGGVKMFVHPLDVVSGDFHTGNFCPGAYQPISTAFSLLGEYDMILGMSFLRNVYALFDYGNYIEASSNDRGDPYIQLLPLTDPTTAHTDFVSVRLNGTDTTGSASKALLPASQESHSPVSAKEKKQHVVGAVTRNWPYILAGCILFVLSVAGCCIYACCCRKRRKSARAFGQNPYQSIQEPPPPMHLKPMNSGAQYADPYHSRG
ncbi:acid protease [Lactifluus subvellereus]|nr:acid protease [Lactifluus subvellereus]